MAVFDALAEAFGFHLSRAWPRGARLDAAAPGRYAWVLESAAGPFHVALWDGADRTEDEARARAAALAERFGPEEALAVWVLTPRADGGAAWLVPGAPVWAYTPAEGRVVRQDARHPLARLVEGALRAAAEAPPPAPERPAEPRGGRLARAWREAPVSYGLMALLTAIFALETAWGGSTDTRTLLKMGANTRELVAEGEWWRLISANFLHIGVGHWAVNTYSLFAVGPAMEAFFGPFRFWMVFLVAGAAGAGASALAHPHGLSAGASGAIFGLIGAMLALGLREGTGIAPFQKKAMRQVALSTLAINVVLAFAIRGLDHFAHAGGFIAGLLLATLLGPSAAWGGPKRRRAAWAVGAAASLVAAGALAYAIALAPARGVPERSVSAPSGAFRFKAPLDAASGERDGVLIVGQAGEKSGILVFEAPQPAPPLEPGQERALTRAFGLKASEITRIPPKPGEPAGPFLRYHYRTPDGREALALTATPERLVAIRTVGAGKRPWVMPLFERAVSTFEAR